MRRAIKTGPLRDVSRGSGGEVESRGPREMIRIFWAVIIRASGEFYRSPLRYWTEFDRWAITECGSSKDRGAGATFCHRLASLC